MHEPSSLFSSFHTFSAFPTLLSSSLTNRSCFCGQRGLSCFLYLLNFVSFSTQKKLKATSHTLCNCCHRVSNQTTKKHKPLTLLDLNSHLQWPEYHISTFPTPPRHNTVKRGLVVLPVLVDLRSISNLTHIQCQSMPNPTYWFQSTTTRSLLLFQKLLKTISAMHILCRIHHS